MEKDNWQMIYLHENKECADCSISLNPDNCWVSIDLGILICWKCAKIHSSLGKSFNHLVQFESKNMEKLSRCIQEYIGMTGNEYNKTIYEYNLPLYFITPRLIRTDDIRQFYITEKYVNKRFLHRKENRGNLRVKLNNLLKEKENIECPNNLQTEVILEEEEVDWERFWFYINEAENEILREGPYTKKKILQLVKDGSIDESTYLWHPALNTWVELIDIPVLFKETKTIPSTLLKSLDDTWVHRQQFPIKCLRGHLERKSKKNPDKWKLTWMYIDKSLSKIVYKTISENERKLKEVNFEGKEINFEIEDKNEYNFGYLTLDSKGKKLVFRRDNFMEIIEWYHELKYIQYIKDTRVTEEPAIIDDYLDPIMTNLRYSKEYCSADTLEAFLFFSTGKMGRAKKYWVLYRKGKIKLFKDFDKKRLIFEIKLEEFIIRDAKMIEEVLPYYFVIQMKEILYEFWSIDPIDFYEWTTKLKSCEIKSPKKNIGTDS